MHSSERFQRLIDYVNRAEELEMNKKRHISAVLEYFKRQMLSDFDRRDSEEKLRTTWREFQLILKGSKLFESFEKDKLFWREIEHSVGVPYKPTEIVISAVNKAFKAEDFFLDVARDVSQNMVSSGEKNLMLFGLWYLQLEARLARPFRSQERIKMVYRVLHPRLKHQGFLEPYRGKEEVENAIKYFVKGAI